MLLHCIDCQVAGNGKLTLSLQTVPEDAFLTTDKGKWMSECFTQQQILEDVASLTSPSLG